MTVDWRGATIDALNTIALQADYSGCGYFWVPEAWGLEAFSTIGHLLTITRQIKIGPGIVNIFSRSAATIGMSCATLNQLAPGRFVLGLGTSGKGLVEYFHGAKFEKKFKRMNEYVEVIKKVSSGQIVEYNGEILKLSRFRLYGQALSSPVPIYLGAIGEKNLALSGVISDGAIVTLWPISKLGDCLKTVGGSSKKKIFAYLPLRLARNEREEAQARAEISKYISFYIASMGKYYAQNLSRLGFDKEVKEAIENKEKNILSDQFIGEFSLIGTPAKILERIASIPDGVHPVFAFSAVTPKDGDDAARSIRDISVELASKKPRPI